MAKPSGILAILAKGKPKGEDEEPDDTTEDSAPESESGEGNVGERASRDAIDAIEAGDAKGLYEAMERIVAACHAGGEE
jgi:hypothetical protein